MRKDLTLAPLVAYCLALLPTIAVGAEDFLPPMPAYTSCRYWPDMEQSRNTWYDYLCISTQAQILREHVARDCPNINFCEILKLKPFPRTPANDFNTRGDAWCNERIARMKSQAGYNPANPGAPFTGNLCNANSAGDNGVFRWKFCAAACKSYLTETKGGR
jgi:hypothetical protein